jgi:HPt (histidine-containing phosphotransfer) domain-containing protein
LPEGHDSLAVIDLDLGMKRIAGKIPKKALIAIGMLLDSLTEDWAQLKQAQCSNDTAAAREVLHKIRGGLNYSGTPRLQHYIEALHQTIKADQDLTKVAPQMAIIDEQIRLLEQQYHSLRKAEQRTS